MAKIYGKNIWKKYMAKIYGKNIWKKYMEKNIWEKYMEKIYGKNSICQHIEFFRTKGFWIVTRKTKRFYMGRKPKIFLYVQVEALPLTNYMEISYGNIIWENYMRKLYEKIIWKISQNISKYQHIWYSYLRFWQKVLGSADTNLRSWGTVYKMLKMHSDWL